MDPAAPNVSVIDIDAYLDRIGYSGDRTPTPEVLKCLQFNHLTRIPFENLDIHLGRPIRLDLASLQVKLVDNRRGGYCFEQNTLFAAVLEQLGFEVTRLSGRVRLGTDRILPRTHMLLNVTFEQTTWLADVGFGGESLFWPIPLMSGRLFEQHNRTYRLIDDEGPWVLQSLIEGVWSNLYAFTLEPQLDIDYEVASYYTSTHPESRFVHTMTVQSRTPDVRQTLHNRELEVRRNGEPATLRAIEDDDELLDVLARSFDLSFPSGTRFHAPVPPASKDEPAS